jgi:hypothetical protein
MDHIESDDVKMAIRIAIRISKQSWDKKMFESRQAHFFKSHSF